MIYELWQRRRWMQRERHRKIWLLASGIIPQLFKVIMLAKRVPTILELNWNKCFSLIRMQNLTFVIICSRRLVHITAKQVISHPGKNENVCEMSKNDKCTCKSCETAVFHCQICKFVTFLLSLSWWLEASYCLVPRRLSCYRVTSFVLLSNWVVLPFRKRKNMPYFFS